MDKKTILAIVLSIIVITVGMTIQQTFFADEMQMAVDNKSNVEKVVTEDDTVVEKTRNHETFIAASEAENKTFVVSNEVIDVTFDTAGASVSSIIVKEENENVEILLKEANGRNGFLLYTENDFTQPILDNFRYELDETDTLNIVKFEQDFYFEDLDQTVTIIKKYAMSKADEYMLQVSVEYVSDSGLLPFNSYTLAYEPQVGPIFTDISKSKYDFRRNYFVEEGKDKKSTIKFKDEVEYVYDNVEWAATVGKYFAVVAIPQGGVNYTTTFEQTTNNTGFNQSNSMYLTREDVSSPAIKDMYSFYCGPKNTASLNRYEIVKDNAFGLKNIDLKGVLDTSSWLGWLENILKFVLALFYKLIPNYGVAIILLTILIKILIQPLAKKGMDSTAKMSALAPKMEELKQKYANEPEQLNIQMAKLYKEEGINPMGSCLPMLLQFPVFIALYGLLNNHYELRGAMFIPGWINDLSIPETIFSLPFSLPLLGPDIHLLPIIYTASMIFSMKSTQNTAGQSDQQKSMMMFMMYGMPIMFFFVLYSAPSGLILYWTVMNFISILQQKYINKKKGKKYKAELQLKEAQAAKKGKRKGK